MLLKIELGEISEIDLINTETMPYCFIVNGKYIKVQIDSECNES